MGCKLKELESIYTFKDIKLGLFKIASLLSLSPVGYVADGAVICSSIQFGNKMFDENPIVQSLFQDLRI